MTHALQKWFLELLRVKAWQLTIGKLDTMKKYPQICHQENAGNIFSKQDPW